VVRGGWGVFEVGVGKSFVVMNFIICRSTAVRAVVNYYEGQAEITHGWPISSSERRSVSGWPTAGADSAVATAAQGPQTVTPPHKKLFWLPQCRHTQSYNSACCTQISLREVAATHRTLLPFAQCPAAVITRNPSRQRDHPHCLRAVCV